MRRSGRTAAVRSAVTEAILSEMRQPDSDGRGSHPSKPTQAAIRPTLRRSRRLIRGCNGALQIPLPQWE